MPSVRPTQPGQSILRCDAHPGGVALVDCLTDDAKMYQYILAGRGNLLMLSHLGCAAQGTDYPILIHLQCTVQ